MCFCLALIDDSFHDSPIHIPPEADDVRIGFPPCFHQRLQFLLRNAHFQSAHGFQSADAAAVAQGQFGDLAALAKVAVYAVLHHRHMKHRGRRCAINVAALQEHLLPPRFSGQPGNHTGLDGRKIADDEFVSRCRNKRCADQLAQGIRHIVIQKLYLLVISAAHQIPSHTKIRHFVLRQILQLDQPAAESACPIRTVEHKHSTGAAIGAHCILHGDVLFHAAFRQLLAKEQHLPQLWRAILQ